MRRTKLISREDTYLYSTYALLAFVCIRQIINIINAGKKGYGISELFLMYTSLNVVTVELITWMVIIVVVFLMWYIPHQKRQNAIKLGEACIGEVLQVYMLRRGGYLMYQLEIDYNTVDGDETLITTLYYDNPREYIRADGSCVVYHYKNHGYLEDLYYQEFNMNTSVEKKIQHAVQDGFFDDADVRKIGKYLEEGRERQQQSKEHVKREKIKYPIEIIKSTSPDELFEISKEWREVAGHKQKRYIRLDPQSFWFIEIGSYEIFSEIEYDSLFSYNGWILLSEMELFAKRNRNKFYWKDASIVEAMVKEFIVEELKKKYRFIKIKEVKVVIAGKPLKCM